MPPEIGIPEDKYDVYVYSAGGASRLVKLTAAENAKLKAGEPFEGSWYDSKDLAKAKAAAELDAVAGRTAEHITRAEAEDAVDRQLEEQSKDGKPRKHWRK